MRHREEIRVVLSRCGLSWLVHFDRADRRKEGISRAFLPQFCKHLLNGWPALARHPLPYAVLLDVLPIPDPGSPAESRRSVAELNIRDTCVV